nr:hypothetical protein [Tanacetum cinerariifolium]
RRRHAGRRPAPARHWRRGALGSPDAPGFRARCGQAAAHPLGAAIGARATWGTRGIVIVKVVRSFWLRTAMVPPWCRTTAWA